MQKLQILIVEDDHSTRKYTNLFWERDGYNPDWAISAAEAKEKIKNKKYDYVISDVSMPIESGSDLAKWIHDNYPSLPVLLTSAVPEIQTMAYLYEKNADVKFIEKPLYPYKFEEAVGIKREDVA
jgi:DNA-binding NtrC family response regulator